MPLLFDRRWEGPHGIGRYGLEVARRIEHVALPLQAKPLDPLDPLRLHRALKRHPKAVFFSPGFNPPLGRPCPFFFTVHDLIHLEIRDESSLLKRLWYETVLRPALRRAEGVFTVSEHSKARLCEWSGLDPQKITVTFNGVSPVFSEKGALFTADRPYFLAVGNHKPHKNIEGLFRAYARSGLKQRLDLRLTGHPGPALARLIEALGIAGSVHFEGRVSEEGLAALYRGALALVLPSLTEGFGLPMVEAMASGTPVIASQRGALPEVGGEAFHPFDPLSEEALIEALRAFEEPGVRTPFRQRGLERAQRFTWSKVARRIETKLRESL